MTRELDKEIVETATCLYIYARDDVLMHPVKSLEDMNHQLRQTQANYPDNTAIKITFDTEERNSIFPVRNWWIGMVSDIKRYFGDD